MRGWRFLLHTNPSAKPVGSIITPLLKNTPCFTWALSPAGEHSFAFFQAKLPFSPKSEQIGKTGGEYQWIGVTAYPVYKFNEQKKQWLQDANSYSANEAVAVMHSYLARWLLPRCTSLPDERGVTLCDIAPAPTQAYRSLHEWCCSPHILDLFRLCV